jgi:hypothetical protein
MLWRDCQKRPSGPHRPAMSQRAFQQGSVPLERSPSTGPVSSQTAEACEQNAAERKRLSSPGSMVANRQSLQGFGPVITRAPTAPVWAFRFHARSRSWQCAISARLGRSQSVRRCILALVESSGMIWFFSHWLKLKPSSPFARYAARGFATSSAAYLPLKRSQFSCGTRPQGVLAYPSGAAGFGAAA